MTVAVGSNVAVGLNVVTDRAAGECTIRPPFGERAAPSRRPLS
jgi:hypothetical protein